MEYNETWKLLPRGLKSFCYLAITFHMEKKNALKWKPVFCFDKRSLGRQCVGLVYESLAKSYQTHRPSLTITALQHHDFPQYNPYHPTYPGILCFVKLAN